MKSLSVPICQTLPSVTPKVVGWHIPSVPSIGLRASHKLLLFLRSSGLLSLFPKGSGLSFAIADRRLGGSTKYLIDLGYDVFVRSVSRTPVRSFLSFLSYLICHLILSSLLYLILIIPLLPLLFSVSASHPCFRFRSISLSFIVTIFSCLRRRDDLLFSLLFLVA